MGSGSRWVLYTPRQFSSFRCKFCQNPDVPSKNNGFLLMPLWGKNPEKMHASQFFRKTPHSGDLRSRAPSESSAKPHVHNQICNGNLESHTAEEDSPNLQPDKTSQQCSSTRATQANVHVHVLVNSGGSDIGGGDVGAGFGLIVGF